MELKQLSVILFWLCATAYEVFAQNLRAENLIGSIDEVTGEDQDGLEARPTSIYAVNYANDGTITGKVVFATQNFNSVDGSTPFTLSPGRGRGLGSTLNTQFYIRGYSNFIEWTGNNCWDKGEGADKLCYIEVRIGTSNTQCVFCFLESGRPAISFNTVRGPDDCRMITADMIVETSDGPVVYID